MKVNDSDTIRARLATWLDRMVSATYPDFHYALKQLWTFLHQNTVLRSICERLEKRPYPRTDTNWEGALDPMFIRNYSTDQLFFDNEDDHYAFCYQVIKRCVTEARAHHANEKLQIEMEFARRYHPNPPLADVKWLYEYFVSTIIQPLAIYLDQALDSNKTILAILQRYKRRTEWFHRTLLHNACNAEPNKGEWLLKLHLFEYLFDNGVDFAIDPYSPLGKADLVSTQQGNERLIADGKLIRDGTGRKPIIDGFHQVYKYALDYDDPFAYLIVFNDTDRDITIGADGIHQGANYVEHNGRTVYVLILDIYPDPVPASKRGQLRSITITREELIAPQEESSAAGGTQGASENDIVPCDT